MPRLGEGCETRRGVGVGAEEDPCFGDGEVGALEVVVLADRDAGVLIRRYGDVQSDGCSRTRETGCGQCLNLAINEHIDITSVVGLANDVIP